MSYIVTLQLDPDSQAHFDRLRQQHFPPAINYIDAHVTLFHHLPEEASVVQEIETAANLRSSFPVAVTGLRSLGKGVAYTLESPELQTLQRRLASAFAGYLTPQDRQKFQPHIVVQNKVMPDAAKALLHQLRMSFVPLQVHAIGLSLWHYRNGPWEAAQTLPFS